MTRRIETNPLHGWDGITRPSPDPWPGLIDDIGGPEATDEQWAAWERYLHDRPALSDLEPYFFGHTESTRP